MSTDYDYIEDNLEPVTEEQFIDDAKDLNNKIISFKVNDYYYINNNSSTSSSKTNSFALMYNNLDKLEIDIENLRADIKEVRELEELHNKNLNINNSYKKTLEQLIPQRDKVFVDLIIKYGLIFGDYLRDRFQKNYSNHIDCLIALTYKDLFEEELKQHRFFKDYEEPSPEAFESFSYHPSKRVNLQTDLILHVYYKDNIDCKELKLEPDFDVNLLTYDGDHLYAWSNCTEPVTSIINNIRKNKAIKLSYNLSQDKLTNLKDKNFTYREANDREFDQWIVPEVP
jgi:hypothetical protein